MLKLKAKNTARKVVALALSFLMAFTAIGNMGSVWASENAPEETDSTYFSFPESNELKEIDGVYFTFRESNEPREIGGSYFYFREDFGAFAEEVSASGESVEPFSIAAQREELQERIHYAVGLLGETAVAEHPSMVPPGRWGATQADHDMLNAAIDAAQNVLNRYIHHPGNLTINFYDCSGNPKYIAAIQKWVNGARSEHYTQSGIISIADIPVGSSVAIDAGVLYDAHYIFLRWDVAQGNAEICPTDFIAEITMPEGGVVLRAIFEYVTHQFYGWDVPAHWCEYAAEWITEYPIEWDYEYRPPLIEPLFDSEDRQGLYDWVFGEIRLSNDEPIVQPFGTPSASVTLIPSEIGYDIAPLAADSYIIPMQPPVRDVEVWALAGSWAWDVTRGHGWSATNAGNVPLTIIHERRVAPHTNDILRISMSENTTSGERTGRVRLNFNDGHVEYIYLHQRFGAALYVPYSRVDVPACKSDGSIHVFSNRAWRVRSNNPSWLTVSPSSGNRNGEFVITARPHSGHTQRQGTITVYIPGAIERTIRVYQEAGLGLALSAAGVTASAMPTGGTFSIYSDRAWTATSSVDWINVSPVSGSGNRELSFTVAANWTTRPSPGYITVRTTSAPIQTRTVRIVQVVGSVVSLSMYRGNATPNPSYGEIWVTSNRPWSVTSRNSWLHVTPSWGNPGTQVFYVFADENAGSERTGHIDVIAAGGRRTVTITQARSVANISVNKNAWYPGIMATSTTVQVSATPGITWTAVSSDSSWITVTPSSRTGSGSLTLSVTRNTTAFVREAWIEISAPGAATRYIDVFQAGTGTLNVSRQSVQLPHTASSEDVMVQSNTVWFTGPSLASEHWLDVRPSMDFGDGTARIIAAANPYPDPRTGHVMITTLANVQHIITVTQAGNPNSIAITHWEMFFDDELDYQIFATRNPVTSFSNFRNVHIGMIRDMSDGIGQYGGLFVFENREWTPVGRVIFLPGTGSFSEENIGAFSTQTTANVYDIRETFPFFTPSPVPTYATDTVLLGFGTWFRGRNLGTSNLRLPNNENDRAEMLRLLNMLTRDTLTVRQTGFRFTRQVNRHWIVEYTAVEGTRLPIGTELMRGVIDSPHTVTLYLNIPATPSGIEVDNLSNAGIPNTGSGSRVNLNTAQSHYTIVADLDENWNWDWNWAGVVSEIEEMPTHIVLGHELIHALRASRGYFIRTDNQRNDRYYSFRVPAPPGGVRRRRSPFEEVLTIGLAYRVNPDGTTVTPGAWTITENALRREHGEATRISHIGGGTHAEVRAEILAATPN